MKQNKSPKLKKALITLAVLLFWLGVWQGVFMAVKNDLLIASPKQVLFKLGELVTQLPFWKSVALSFLRIAAGYVLGVTSAVLLCVLTTRFKACFELFSPFIKTVRSVPVASFIILALVWLKKTYVPVFIVFLIVMPVVWQSISDAVSKAPKPLLETAEIYGFGFFKKVRTVYFQAAFPSFESACITALGLSWKSGVAAEVLAVPVSSIGYNLYRSKINLETDELFAWTAVVVVLSIGIEKLLTAVIKRTGGKSNG